MLFKAEEVGRERGRRWGRGCIGSKFLMQKLTTIYKQIDNLPIANQF